MEIKKMKTITEKRFLELIKKQHFLIKRNEEFNLNLDNYWAIDKLSPLMAMFFNYKDKNKEEYVKIYLNKRDKKVNIYLLNRGESLGVNIKGNKEFRDLLIKGFKDYDIFRDYLINLGENIKNF